MRTALYVDASLLSFPGTADRAWRDGIADALDRGREWLERLEVVLVGAREMTSEVDAAMHGWGTRLLFGGASYSWLGFISAVALDVQPPYPDQLLLLYPRPRARNVSAQRRIDNLELQTTVRMLPCRDDVVTPVSGEDLEEVFASVARRY